MKRLLLITRSLGDGAAMLSAVCARDIAEKVFGPHMYPESAAYTTGTALPLSFSHFVCMRERKLMMSSHQHTRLNVNAVMSLTDA